MNHNYYFTLLHSVMALFLELFKFALVSFYNDRVANVQYRRAVRQPSSDGCTVCHVGHSMLSPAHFPALPIPPCIQLRVPAHVVIHNIYVYLMLWSVAACSVLQCTDQLSLVPPPAVTLQSVTVMYMHTHTYSVYNMFHPCSFTGSDSQSSSDTQSGDNSTSKASAEPAVVRSSTHTQTVLCVYIHTHAHSCMSLATVTHFIHWNQ